MFCFGLDPTQLVIFVCQLLLKGVYLAVVFSLDILKGVLEILILFFIVRDLGLAFLVSGTQLDMLSIQVLQAFSKLGNNSSHLLIVLRLSLRNLIQIYSQLFVLLFSHTYLLFQLFHLSLLGSQIAIGLNRTILHFIGNIPLEQLIFLC